MDPLDISNTLRAHHSLRAALYFPDVMESIHSQRSVSHRQQEKATAQDQIAALRARKVNAVTGAQQLFDRMKDSMDARTFHHVLQGVMDIQANRKSSSEVVEQLRPLVAHRNPRLFADFLDYIDPANDIERQQITHEPAQADGAPSPVQSGSKALNDHSAPEDAGLLACSVINPGTFVHPGQPASPLRRVANFSQYAVKAGSPSPTREMADENSPGMSGFPAAPIFYSPMPPTFAQSWYDYVNQDRPVTRYPVETAMPTHGLPLPPISAINPRNLQNTNNVRLPSIGRFGPGMNPYSPRAVVSPQMGPTKAFPTQQYQQQFRLPNTRATLPEQAHPHPTSPYQGDFTFLSPEKVGPYDHSHSFLPYAQDVHFNAPNAPTMQVARQAPLQRKRGISDLRSEAQPRKVSKTESGSRSSRVFSTKSSTSGRISTSPDNKDEKPYIHHICGRRFTTLEAVRGHHHSDEDGLGCWVRYGSKEKDKAWDMHPSCKVEITKNATAGTFQESPLLPIKLRTSRPIRTSSKNSRRKSKSNESFHTTSSSSEHQEDDDDEYLPELGMTQKQVDEIRGARPKRKAVPRKMSGTKRSAAKKIVNYT